MHDDFMTEAVANMATVLRAMSEGISRGDFDAWLDEHKDDEDTK